MEEEPPSLLCPENRKIQQNHAYDDEDAQYGPNKLYFLLMFFIEKHIIQYITT